MRNRLVVVAAVDIPHEKTLNGFRAEVGFAEQCLEFGFANANATG